MSHTTDETKSKRYNPNLGTIIGAAIGAMGAIVAAVIGISAAIGNPTAASKTTGTNVSKNSNQVTTEGPSTNPGPTSPDSSAIRFKGSVRVISAELDALPILNNNGYDNDVYAKVDDGNIFARQNSGKITDIVPGGGANLSEAVCRSAALTNGRPDAIALKVGTVLCVVTDKGRAASLVVTSVPPEGQADQNNPYFVADVTVWEHVAK